MECSCEMKEQAPQPTLTIRTRTVVQDLPQVMGESYGAIAQFLAGVGEHPAGPPFAAYYNMDTKDLDVEIGFPVSKEIAGKDNIQCGELPRGKIATCVYYGPYVEMVPAYETLASWVEENGYEATGIAYEFYLNDPGEVPPEELMTQIVFPLK